MIRHFRAKSWALLWLCSLGCSGQNTVDVMNVQATSAGAGDAAAAAGSNATGSSGGSAGAAGNASSSGGAAGAPPCASAADCPAIENPCATVLCSAGACQSDPAPWGSNLLPDIPGDCHALMCDGRGAQVTAVDLANLPPANELCTAPACDNGGTPYYMPLPAGSACSSDTGGRVCDGNSQCVPCLIDADCSAGLACVLHDCAPPECSNGVQDGLETGVDCGGACAPCSVSSCSDLQKDGDETDVDCGGACPPCAVAETCAIDQDCASDDCDPVTHVCLTETCIDQRKDGSETDVDCGGSACSGCFDGLNCLLDSDCAAHHCDPMQHLCFGNTCADLREDGDETDVDCGGAICGPCSAGKKCNTPFDCDSYCSQAIPHVCL